MTDDNIKLGAKLPLEWRSSETWIELPPEQSLYASLTELGFSFVELGLGDLLKAEERDLLESECQACRRTGLDVSLHPYLDGPAKIAHLTSRPECTQAIKRIFDAAGHIAHSSIQPVNLIFHPAEDVFDPTKTSPAQKRTDLLQTSQHFADRLNEEMQARDAKINLMLEHQVPPTDEEKLIRIGDTAQELLKVVEDTQIAICWDTGHYLLSVDRHNQPLDPPRRFLQRVQHVHLHDVRSGRDHQPIDKDSVHIKRWTQQLQEIGYSGTITLEYEPDAVRNAGGFQTVAQQSLSVLRAWLESG